MTSRVTGKKISKQVDHFRALGMKAIVCIVVSLGLVACREPEELPNGFSIKRRDTGKYEIVSPPYVAANGVTSSSGVISPDVTKVAVLGDLVVGYSEKVKEADGFMTPGGYFLLHTKTKETREGMGSSELRNLLASEYQINQEPELKLIHRY
jgi:hypothetical protein